MRRKVTFYLGVWQVDGTRAGQNYHVLRNKLRFIKHNPAPLAKNFSSFVYSAPLKLHLKQYTRFLRNTQLADAEVVRIYWLISHEFRFKFELALYKI